MEGNAVREGKGEIHERIGRGERREVIRQREKKKQKKDTIYIRREEERVKEKQNT